MNINKMYSLVNKRKRIRYQVSRLRSVDDIKQCSLFEKESQNKCTQISQWRKIKRVRTRNMIKEWEQQKDDFDGIEPEPKPMR